jgi:hypothetical protein
MLMDYFASIDDTIQVLFLWALTIWASDDYSHQNYKNKCNALGQGFKLSKISLPPPPFYSPMFSYGFP